MMKLRQFTSAHLNNAILAPGYQQIPILPEAAAVRHILETGDSALHLPAETIVDEHLNQRAARVIAASTSVGHGAARSIWRL